MLDVAEEAGSDLLLTPRPQQWPKLRPHVQGVVKVVNAAPPGSHIEVNIPYPPSWFEPEKF